MPEGEEGLGAVLPAGAKAASVRLPLDGSGKRAACDWRELRIESLCAALSAKGGSHGDTSAEQQQRIRLGRCYGWVIGDGIIFRGRV